MRANAPMKADLHDFSRGVGSVHHGAALLNGVAGRFLHKDMGASLQSGNRLKRVPVIRRGDDGDIDLFLGKELAEIRVKLGGDTRQVTDLLGADLGGIGIYITKRHGLATAFFNRHPQDIHAPPPSANEGGAILFAGLGLRADKGRGKRRTPGREKEGTSIGHYAGQ